MCLALIIFWQSEDKNEKKVAKNVKIYLIPLSEAATLSGYTAEHLNLMCRKGILRGKKVNGEPRTTSEIPKPGTESLQYLWTLAGIHAPVQDVPHLLPP